MSDDKSVFDVDPAAQAERYIKADYFTLFGLKRDFDVDVRKLKPIYQQLQMQFHPDKFASRPTAEQRVAMQLASRVNEAYQTLCSDVRRAAYLLELEGFDTTTEQTTADVDFLMQQMELREELEEACRADDPESQLETLQETATQFADELNQQFDALYKSGDYPSAYALYARMQFAGKLLSEIDSALDRLLDD